MKVPGPQHPISVTPNPNRVVVTFDGRTLAETTRALTMYETAYAPVHYIPRADIDMTLLERSEHATYCPYKGDAAYFSLRSSGRLAENAAWTYEAPYEAVAEIRDRLAFYPELVDAIEERAA